MNSYVKFGAPRIQILTGLHLFKAALQEVYARQALMEAG